MAVSQWLLPPLQKTAVAVAHVKRGHGIIKYNGELVRQPCSCTAGLFFRGQPGDAAAEVPGDGQAPCSWLHKGQKRAHVGGMLAALCGTTPSWDRRRQRLPIWERAKMRLPSMLGARREASLSGGAIVVHACQAGHCPKGCSWSCFQLDCCGQ